jgi:alpha-1,6-mannosyltransferase
MHIVDVSALYSPKGGGIRTYVERKLAAAPRSGHDITVIAPGEENGEQIINDHARMVTVKSPRFPLDRNYFYFEDDETIHRALDATRPDFVECSSPWGSATAVGEWQGACPRALVMHADPLSAYAYRWLEPVASRALIDKGFDWFWRHLRRLDSLYDAVICASPSLAARLAAGGVTKAQTQPMGVEPGIFSPRHRDPALRARLLARAEMPESATLLIGAGRLSSEKRWPMLMAAATAAGYSRPLALAIAGDGRNRRPILRAARENPHILMLSPVSDRAGFARLLASADVLVHGCEAETFCMVAAEGRASGLPIVVPDEGGAGDQATPDSGIRYRSADAAAAAQAIGEAIDRLPALTAAARLAAPGVRTMDQHFDELFAAYTALCAGGRVAA